MKMDHGCYLMEKLILKKTLNYEIELGSAIYCSLDVTIVTHLLSN